MFIGIWHWYAFESSLCTTKETEFPIGEDKNGTLISADLSQLHHLLISVAAGSGKSVFADSMLLTLIFHNPPEKLRFILCDTKMTEFGQYNGIPHMLIPVCTDPKVICDILLWAKDEGQKRLRSFASCGVKNIFSYNDHTWENYGEELARIIIVIDDLSSVLNTSPEASECIKNLLSIGRAVGIHIVAVTQTPTEKHTKEVASLFFSKMIFQTATLSELRFMTGQRNPSTPLCPGDALFCSGASLSQVHLLAPGIRDTNDILSAIRANATCCYDEETMRTIERHIEEKEKIARGVGGSDSNNAGDYDELLPAAVDVVMETGQASVSMIQRRLKLGYGRAARLVDQMEERGIVGHFDGSKPRQLLITKRQRQEMQSHQGKVNETLIVVEPAKLTTQPNPILDLPPTTDEKTSQTSETISSQKKALEISMKGQILWHSKIYTVSVDGHIVGLLKCGQKVSIEIEEGPHELSFLLNGKPEKETTVRVFPDDELLKFSIELDLFGHPKLYKDS